MKHKHPKQRFQGILGPLTILASPVFDIANAERMPYVSRHFPTATPSESTIISSAIKACAQSARRRRASAPMTLWGSPKNTKQKWEASQLFDLKPGDTVIVEALAFTDDPENEFGFHEIYRIRNGSVEHMQQPAERHQHAPQLVS